MDRDAASRAAAPSLATTAARRLHPVLAGAGSQTACRHSGKAHQGMISQLDF